MEPGISTELKPPGQTQKHPLASHTGIVWGGTVRLVAKVESAVEKLKFHGSQRDTGLTRREGAQPRSHDLGRWNLQDREQGRENPPRLEPEPPHQSLTRVTDNRTHRSRVTVASILRRLTAKLTARKVSPLDEAGSSPERRCRNSELLIAKHGG